jgi:hypothetical protein
MSECKHCGNQMEPFSRFAFEKKALKLNMSTTSEKEIKEVNKYELLIDDQSM